MSADILDLNAKRLERLETRQFIRQAMVLPAKRRLDLILDRDDAQVAVAAMDPNDFFFTVQELGPDDALALVALGTVEQINHLFDMQWWKKDAVEPARALMWLERLARADARKLLEWLANADFELLISLFKQWITVMTAPEDVDLVEARENLPPRTLDDFYFWEARYPQYDDLLVQVLSMIFETSSGFFRELMNNVLSAPTAEVEELAYSFHRARLSDNGVPEFYDALEIYRSAAAHEVRKRPAPDGRPGENAPPGFALALLRRGDLLERILGRIESPEMGDTLSRELAALANKVVIADQLATDSAEALRAGVEKTLAYVNLGLDLLSEGAPKRARKILEEVFAEHLFRRAQGEVARVRGRMAGLLGRGWLADGGLRRLDGEWFDAAERLLEKTPKLFRKTAGQTEGTGREDFFRTVEDIARGDYLVDVLTAAGDLYGALATDPKTFEAGLWDEGQVRSKEDVTLGVMVLTAAARLLTYGKWAAEPLALREWPEIFARVQPGPMDEAVMNWMHAVTGNPANRSLAADYLCVVLRDYETQMRPFSAQNIPEPQLTPFFMFENG